MVLKNPGDLLRLLVVAVLVYPALVVILRVSGKRTLSKLNAFDLVVTVALGSTLATILLSRDVSLAEGALALALLVGLQYLVAVLAVRWPPSQRLLKSQPTLQQPHRRTRRAAVVGPPGAGARPPATGRSTGRPHQGPTRRPGRPVVRCHLVSAGAHASRLSDHISIGSPNGSGSSGPAARRPICQFHPVLP
ncbi:hypothetical protein [Plantactinospora sp. GCM10030261]|uniref:hypothetical protein n=1 Tax=Plantactinospora sp. GCM10030261 TaxID=3273420 RepID=UPI0036102091